MEKHKLKSRRRQRRHIRLRKKLQGTSEKPRLAVFRSSRHIYAQVIDDESKKTLLSCSTLVKDMAKSIKNTGNQEAATAVGKEIARLAKEAGISKVAFDRCGFKYHGRVEALADGSRDGGLDIGKKRPPKVKEDKGEKEGKGGKKDKGRKDKGGKDKKQGGKDKKSKSGKEKKK